MALEKRFTLIAPFAHGPTGSTYMADEPETGRRGLLKVLAPAARTQVAERQRMRRELLKQATMTAANLALPFATGETDTTLWLFREQIEGTPLHAHLAQAGALSQSDALVIVSQLTTALDDLHRAGLLHRDVKPGHVLLARDASGGMRAVLIDSGVCRPLDGASTTTVFGTPGYVAPEQLAGKLVSFRSDLYALGCVLFEMLTGSAPFAREDVPSTLAAQVAGELPALPSALSPQVAALVQSLLAKDPQDRPFSAQKLRRALDPYLPHGATVNRHPNASLAKPPIPPPAGPRAPSIRPPVRTSVPPLPPGRRSTPDATQQVQLEQIFDVAPSMRTAPSVAPPPPAAARRSEESAAARKRDATEPVELDHVLEVSPAKGSSVDTTQEYRPTADQTQQIRLDQILAVADQRKKALSVPPAKPSEVAAPAPAAAAPVAAAPALDASAPPSDEHKLPSIELNLPDEGFDSDTPDSAFRATGAHEAEATTQILDDESRDEPDIDKSVTVVAERPNPDSRGAHATLVGMPRAVLPPEAGTPALGSEAPPPLFAADTPRHVDLHGGDSAQLTLPRDPAAAIAAAERMEADQGLRAQDEQKLPVGADPSRKLAFAAAAVVLLGLLSVGVTRLLRSDPDAVGEQDKTREPVASAEPGNDKRSEQAPTVMPLAATPKAEPTPTVTSMAQPQAKAEPAVQAPPADAAPVAKAEPKAAPKADSEKPSARRERSAEPREPAADKEELWAKARDEARAHYAAKRFKEAAKAYEKATKYNPSNAGTYAGLGGARLQAGDTRGAIQAYQKAVQLSSSTSGFHAALGRAYLTAGDKAKARASYKKALALDPSNEAAKTVLSTL